MKTGCNVRSFTSAEILVLLSSFSLSGVCNAQQDSVPFGDRISTAIKKYNRMTPNTASAGKITEGSMAYWDSSEYLTFVRLKKALPTRLSVRMMQ